LIFRPTGAFACEILEAVPVRFKFTVLPFICAGINPSSSLVISLLFDVRELAICLVNQQLTEARLLLTQTGCCLLTLFFCPAWLLAK
jgi:hypothetical protein